ncbi:MAG TPA: Ig-like domain-containing protein, partial [Gemmatimonadales bacterium]|nr:Ig-like domain-containing protein [Gemmatimonadales bacterium]
MKQTRAHGPFGGAGKYFAYFVSTGAALAALLVNARNLGLASWLGANGLGFANHAARRVTLTPKADTAFALGDTIILAATVTDRQGSVLVGAQLAWQSEDSAVATVDSTGAVVARGPGTTRVSVKVRNLTADSRVIVVQRPVRVVVLGDTALTLREGDSLRLNAQALDAREHRLRYPVPEWRSADTSVAVVDSSGLVEARSAGRTTFTATLGNLSAIVIARVDLAPASLHL